MITTTLHGDEAAQTELCDRVKQFLASRHFASFRKLNVTVLGDSVVLDGCVPRFHERQLAVALCRHVPGVYRVVDRLIVPEADGSQGSAGIPRRPK
jgi:osmotically-inducible protein OsmY